MQLNIQKVQHVFRRAQVPLVLHQRFSATLAQIQPKRLSRYMYSTHVSLGLNAQILATHS